MTRPKTLTAAFVKTVNQPGRYGDGRGSYGLSLLVKPTANGRWSKTWAQRVRVNGRQVHIGLGAWPVVTLAEARTAALENRRIAAQGKDPRTATETPTFAEATEAVIVLHRQTWKPASRSEQQWRASLATHVLPKIGDRLIDDIGTADVLMVLAPVWLEHHETGRRLASRISAVMAHAIAAGHRTDDPTAAVVSALPRPKNGKTHHAALHHCEVGTLLAEVRASHAPPAARLALELIALTATRSNEVRSMMWAEIDGDVWTIPGERTKTAKAHRVPLSSRALEVLAEAATLTDGTGLVFTGRTGRPVTNEAVRQLLNLNPPTGLWDRRFGSGWPPGWCVWAGRWVSGRVEPGLGCCGGLVAFGVGLRCAGRCAPLR